MEHRMMETNKWKTKSNTTNTIPDIGPKKNKYPNAEQKKRKINKSNYKEIKKTAKIILKTPTQDTKMENDNGKKQNIPNT